MISQEWPNELSRIDELEHELAAANHQLEHLRAIEDMRVAANLALVSEQRAHAATQQRLADYGESNVKAQARIAELEAQLRRGEKT